MSPFAFVPALPQTPKPSGEEKVKLRTSPEKQELWCPARVGPVGSRIAWVLASALPLPHCISSNTVLLHSPLQFSHL